ncbi:MAG: Wzz/FepE/Etk N-terminal domain-containing protein, partial [Anaerolineae bacterium]
MMSDTRLYEDDLDLRKITLTLWRYRYLLIVTTLLAALAAYALSIWVLPKKYQAVAYVTVVTPSVQYTTAGGLGIIPPQPDIRPLPEIAQSKTILEQVKADARLTSFLPKNAAGWIPDTQVYTVGDTLLRFQVTDTNPKRAAMFVNIWAEKTADWVEMNYGTGEFAANLDNQIQQAKQAYA